MEELPADGAEAPLPPTPQAAAVKWVEAVMDVGDLSAAWPGTDPTLRLVLAQDWIWTRRHDPAIGHDQDWEALARALAATPPEHPLWERFASELLSVWHKIWSGFSAEGWAVSEEPEVLDLDLEMVTFMETAGRDIPGRPRGALFARRFAMRHTSDGWKVASINGDQMFTPGWPPSLQRQPGPF